MCSYNELLRRAQAAAIAVFLLVLFAGAPRAQFERTISTTFDGWHERADGTFELVFGYMNRNPADVDVLIGPGNKVEPTPDDRGQPTHFLPGRQRSIFSVIVPAGFKGKYIWTLTYAGTTQTATASIDQNYSLDVGDPEPPGVKAPADMTVRLSEAVPLKPAVSPPPVPPAPANADVVPRRSAGGRVTVWWSKFRGPGEVTFGDGHAGSAAPAPTGRESALGSFRVMCASAREAGCGATSARFSAPGIYLLRVVAAERSASNSLMKVTVTP